MIEPDRPPLGKLFIFLVAFFFILVVTGIGLANFLKLNTIEQLDSKVLSLENPELTEIKVRTQSLLHSYDIIDSKQGVYRIPIEKAMELLVNNPAYIEPMPESPLRKK